MSSGVNGPLQAAVNRLPQIDTPTAELGPKPMQVVVVSSQKGGSGKTTLCGHLAVQAERCGAGPVALIDTDPQGSLAGWWNARSAETPVFVKTEIRSLGKDIESLRAAGVRLVFVDTPPAITSALAATVEHASLVIVPTRPSPHDLRAVGSTLDTIEAQEKPMVFAVNGANPRARMTSAVAVALSQYGTVAPVTVHHRTDFATSMINGGTVVEAAKPGRSASEIEELWTYLSVRLDKLLVQQRRESPTVLPQTALETNRQFVSSPARVFGRRIVDGVAKGPVTAGGRAL